jgi:hypothetical protein
MCLYKLLRTVFLLLPVIAFAKIYVVVEGLQYKPELKPFISKELNLIKRNWGNYTLLSLKELKNVKLSEEDIVVVLGEYYGWRVEYKGKPKWLVLDYCDSCSSIDLKKNKADYILCSATSIPAYGFEKIYEIPLERLSIGEIVKKLKENFNENGYEGQLGKIKLKLIVNTNAKK